MRVCDEVRHLIQKTRNDNPNKCLDLGYVDIIITLPRAKWIQFLAEIKERQDTDIDPDKYDYIKFAGAIVECNKPDDNAIQLRNGFLKFR